MTATTAVLPGMSAAGRRQGEKIDALDLEPVACKLMHPELGAPVMTLAEADHRIAAYRCFLKLCAWYPGETIVPSQEIDEAWHAHILDTAKYADDTEQVFGYFLHHFPYLGLRGPEDATRWQAASERTRELSRTHFGAGLPGGAARRCHNGGSSCNQNGFCNGPGACKSGSAIDWPRPRPDRTDHLIYPPDGAALAPGTGNGSHEAAGQRSAPGNGNPRGPGATAPPFMTGPDGGIKWVIAARKLCGMIQDERFKPGDKLPRNTGFA